jgi:hypothetical protein
VFFGIISKLILGTPFDGFLSLVQLVLFKGLILTKI